MFLSSSRLLSINTLVTAPSLSCRQSQYHASSISVFPALEQFYRIRGGDDDVLLADIATLACSDQFSVSEDRRAGDDAQVESPTTDLQDKQQASNDIDRLLRTALDRLDGDRQLTCIFRVHNSNS